MTAGHHWVHVFVFSLLVLIGCGTAESGVGGRGGSGGEGGDPGAGGGGGAGPSSFPCTEEAIRDAIELGGGPHTFECDGPTVIVTEAEIWIDNDVVLDGEGDVTVDGDGHHRVFGVPPGVTSELHGFKVTGGAPAPSPATSEGGGIHNDGHLTLIDCVISGNAAEASGGLASEAAGGLWNGGAATLTDTVVSNNMATTIGPGGIGNRGSLTMTGGSISGNSTVSGAGTALFNLGSASLMDVAIEGNSGFGSSAVFNGSGPADLPGDLTLRRCMVADNESGAIFNALGAVALVGSTVSGNAYGGIFNQSQLKVINSTVSGNSHGSPPGFPSGIENFSRFPSPPAELTLISSTLAYNEGGSLGNSRGSVVARSSIVEGGCLGPSVSISDGYNIEVGGDTCGFTDPRDETGVALEDVELGPLGNNGGPTPTHSLGEGSIAIDLVPESRCLDGSGAPLSEDQRGQPRPVGSGAMCDVGAFEVQPSP